MSKNPDRPEAATSDMKESHPKQAVIDPATGRDVTGDYVSESRKQMEEDLDKIFKQAQERKDKEDKTKIINELAERIEQAISKHFSSMKLPPDEELIKKSQDKLKQILS